MANEYKTLIFNDDAKGRLEMAESIDELSGDGWTLKSREVTPQNWSFGKTCCLGCIFLPLALLGKKKNIITVIMERKRRTTSTSKQKHQQQNVATATSKEDDAIIAKVKKPWHKTWWGITVIILLAVFVGLPVLIGVIEGLISISTGAYS